MNDSWSCSTHSVTMRQQAWGQKANMLMKVEYKDRLNSWCHCEAIESILGTTYLWISYVRITNPFRSSTMSLSYFKPINFRIEPILHGSTCGIYQDLAPISFPDASSTVISAVRHHRTGPLSSVFCWSWLPFWNSANYTQPLQGVLCIFLASVFVRVPPGLNPLTSAPLCTQFFGAVT